MMRFKILQTNARRKGINIEYAPIFMKRHRENISFWYTKEKLMFWVLQFQFEVSDRLQSGDLTSRLKFHNLVIEPQSEEAPFSEILQSLDWNESKMVEWLGYGYLGWQEGGKGFGKLKFYLENTYNKQEAVNCQDLDKEVKKQIEEEAELIEIKLCMTLKDLLWHISFVEFPNILVVKEEEDQVFRLKYRNDKIKRKRHMQIKELIVESNKDNDDTGTRVNDDVDIQEDYLVRGK